MAGACNNMPRCFCPFLFWNFLKLSPQTAAISRTAIAAISKRQILRTLVYLRHTKNYNDCVYPLFLRVSIRFYPQQASGQWQSILREYEDNFITSFIPRAARP